MNLEIARDIAIPVVAILLPSLIAVWLARQERIAAAKDRADANIRLEETRRDSGIEEALEAMADLVEATYTNDFREAAKMRLRAARRLPRVYRALGTEQPDVAKWIAEELAIVSQGLEKTDHVGLSILAEQIVWRSASFINALTDWRAGERDANWFRVSEHAPLAATLHPDASDT